MSKRTAIDGQLDGQLAVLSIAVQEIARALAPAQVAQVSAAVRARVAERAAALAPNSEADNGMSAELAALLRALGTDGAASNPQPGAGTAAGAVSSVAARA